MQRIKETYYLQFLFKVKTGYLPFLLGRRLLIPLASNRCGCILREHVFAIAYLNFPPELVTPGERKIKLRAVPLSPS